MVAAGGYFADNLSLLAAVVRPTLVVRLNCVSYASVRIIIISSCVSGVLWWSVAATAPCICWPLPSSSCSKIVANGQRAFRGETILRGTIVWFVDGGDGVYVGGADDADAASQSSQPSQSGIRGQDHYTFEFGVGSAGACKRIDLASMDPRHWNVRPRSAISGVLLDKQDRRLKRANETPLNPQAACDHINGSNADGAECGHPAKRQR
eukprot:COSAG05_NODE_1315_length_5211_cov_2.184077_1_plen_208_part_00